ncbi:LacI family DNA-binding transcriptional regulator [Sphaerotilus microaerophilus]|uniref:LacI family transcriptional regulator n=1 Tax=Sphaerotilus microaerophilus TaxID=2914710 RepID=A0ABN6PTH2_9BURK|nr:LacI family DNA-binding transcriptional regulator [Sphaerotilus sp. FB-5]BDI06540.1 LacI family transcriptional regulator [Sphaerotilus sp. FB-5]
MSDLSDDPTAPGGTRRRKAATIRDVAQAAGVSTATVSKFINGGQRFTREVEDRLTTVIRELGYVSNPLARGMITGQTGNVGIVILDILNPHFTSLVKGASRVARQAGLNLLFTDAAEGEMPELAMLQALSRRVDGLVVSARLSDASLDWLVQAGPPAVYYGGRTSHPGCFSVGSDNSEAALMLGRHLRDLGHRRIAYVGFSGARWSADRHAGLLRAFEGSGVELRLHDVQAPVPEEGERIASSVLLCSEPPDAVVAYNDLLALGLMSQAQVLGLNVPGDVSVAGFDNIIYSRYTSPALTTVDMGSEAVGAIAMQRLVERIRGEAAGGGHETLIAHVLPRGSTRRRGERA